MQTVLQVVSAPDPDLILEVIHAGVGLGLGPRLFYRVQHLNCCIQICYFNITFIIEVPSCQLGLLYELDLGNSLMLT